MQHTVIPHTVIPQTVIPQTVIPPYEIEKIEEDDIMPMLDGFINQQGQELNQMDCENTKKTKPRRWYKGLLVAVAILIIIVLVTII